MTVLGTLPGRVTARALVVLLVALAAVLVLAHRLYQTAEISVAGAVISVFSPSGTTVDAAAQTVYFGLGSVNPLGLRMTPECTSAFLLIPLLLIAAVMIALRPRISRRVLLALAIAGLALVVVNQLRILTLVGLVGWLGTDQGYYLGHTLLGSLVSVIGGAAALVLFVWVATRREKP